MFNKFNNEGNDFMQPNNSFMQSGKNFNDDNDFMKQNNTDFIDSKQADDLLDDIMDGFTPPEEYNNTHQNGNLNPSTVDRNSDFVPTDINMRNNDFMSENSNNAPQRRGSVVKTDLNNQNIGINNQNRSFIQAYNQAAPSAGFNQSAMGYNNQGTGNVFAQRNDLNLGQQTGNVPTQCGVKSVSNNFNQNHCNYGQNDFNSANNGGNAYTDDDILDSFNRDELTQSYESERLVQVGADAPVIFAPQINNLPNGISRYKAIISRQISQIFIVTGDRRSGKTRTSMEIARHFANQKIKTLYVDFDTEYRGSLMYYDLSNFASCPPTVTSGLLQARSSTALSRNVYRQAGIPFDSLLALYDVNITDEALKEIQIQLAYQAKSYGCIVIDCPLDKLYVMEEAMALATIYCCIPSDLSGMLSTFMKFSKIEPLDEHNRNKGNNATRLTYKGIAYLYPRMQYLVNQVDNKNIFADNCEYISSLFSMDRDKYNWSRCKFAGYMNRLPEVLQAMI